MFLSLRSIETQHSFCVPAFARRRNIMSNNVSATMCPRLPVPLGAVSDTKFVSATNVALAGKRGNICVGNNVSAAMCRKGTGKRGHIVAETLLPMTFPCARKLGNICCGHKMFLNKIRNIFVSATNVARADKRGNICVGNNVPATMCPRLPIP